MHQFKSTHVEFDGFSEYFETEIAPILSKRDGARVDALAKTKRIGIPAAIVTAIVSFCLAYWSRTADLYVLAFAMGPAAYFAVRTHFLHQIAADTKATLTESVFGFINWRFETVCDPIKLAPWEDIFLLPSGSNLREFEDRISGQSERVRFDSVEATLKRKPRFYLGEKHTSTLFQGQLIQVTFEQNFTVAKTVVLRDKGWFNPERHVELKRVGLVDPVFEEIFEAYSTDQVEGRVVLNPAFMQTLIDLEQAVMGNNIRFAFLKNRMLIAVETPDLFEAGSMKDALNAPARAQRILDEVGALLDIAQALRDRTK